MQLTYTHMHWLYHMQDLAVLITEETTTRAMSMVEYESISLGGCSVQETLCERGGTPYVDFDAC